MSDDVKLRVLWHGDILKKVQQDLKDSTSLDRDKVLLDPERYKLNMEVLTWIVNTDSLFLMHSKEYKNSRSRDIKTDGILWGLYYAFNCFKHNMNIASIEKMEEKEHNLLKFMNMKIASIDWISSDDDRLDTKKNKHAYDAYAEYLSGKSVREIFDFALRFLLLQYEKIKNE